MRKVLLATTALVALGGVSAASADISLSGSAAWQYKSWSDTTANTGGNNDTDQYVETDVKISMSNTTDSGLSITAFANIDEGAGSSSRLQDKGFTIGGDWGTLGFAGSESGDALATSADVAADEANSAAGTVGFDGDEALPAAEVSFKSASINGFTATAGIGDAGAASTADSQSFGISYSTSAGGASVTAQYATASVDSSTPGGTNDYSATSAGLKISTGNIGLTLASNTKKIDEGATEKYSGVGVGLTYKMSDSMSLALHNKDAENDADADYSYEETAASVTYTIASGVVGYLTYTDWSFTPNSGSANSESGNYTHAEVKVSF